MRSDPENGVMSFRCDLEADHLGRHHHTWVYDHQGHVAGTSWPNDPPVTAETTGNTDA